MPGRSTRTIEPRTKVRAPDEYDNHVVRATSTICAISSSVGGVAGPVAMTAIVNGRVTGAAACAADVASVGPATAATSKRTAA